MGTIGFFLTCCMGALALILGCTPTLLCAPICAFLTISTLIPSLGGFFSVLMVELISSMLSLGFIALALVTLALMLAAPFMLVRVSTSTMLCFFDCTIRIGSSSSRMKDSFS